MLYGILETLGSIGGRNGGYGVDCNYYISFIPAGISISSGANTKVCLSTISLEDSWGIGSDITIAVEFRAGNITHQETNTERTAVGLEMEDGRLVCRMGNYLQAKGGRAPAVVAKLIRAHTVSIGGKTVVGGVEGYPPHDETNATVVVLLSYGENGTVGGLQAPVGGRSVKGSCEAVGAIVAYEGIVLRTILQRALGSGTTIVI